MELSFNDLMLIFISAMLVNNFVLSRFLGLCPFFGVSKKLETAIGMGMAVIFVMMMASVCTWLLWNYVLVPDTPGNIIKALTGREIDLTYLKTIAYILVIASLVQFT